MISADAELMVRLRAHDGTAFRELVAAHHPRLLRLARTWAEGDSKAEEMVRTTWRAVIAGLDGYEQRASLTSWITLTLFDVAHSTFPTDSLPGFLAVPPSSSVDPARFCGPPGGGAWADPPATWISRTESPAGSLETAALVVGAIRRLPDDLRLVVLLRDVEHWSSDDVCDALGTSAVDHRALLHRGRSVVRATLEATLGRGPGE